MAKEVNSGSVHDELFKLFVNGEEVQAGSEVILISAKDNELKVEDTSGQVEELRLGLAHSERKLEAFPGFGSGVSPTDRTFVWKITPEDADSWSARLIFYSPNVVKTMEIYCRIVPIVSFGYIDLLGRPLPEEVKVGINVFFTPAVLLKSKEVPVEEAPVHFLIDEHGSSDAVTGPLGRAIAGIYRYPTKGKRNIHATTEHLGKTVSANLLVDVQ